MAGYSGTPLVRKIGIKPGSRIALVNKPDNFQFGSSELPGNVEFVSARANEIDVVMLFATTRKVLERQLATLSQRIATDGMLWVAWPKKASGMASDLNENVVRAGGLALGLVDVKVCAVNEIWSGLKFVIPVKARASRAAAPR